MKLGNRFAKKRTLFFFVAIVLATVTGYLHACRPWKSIATVDRIKSFPNQNLPLIRPATIYWNENQFPFIDAKTDEDAAYLLGMVHAHLRLGQMEMIRRIAYGRLSESFGPMAVKYDELLRAFHFSKLSEVSEKSLPAFTRVWLMKFVEGINHYVQNASELPFEFRYFNLDPKETWTVKDILTISRLAAADFNWREILSYLASNSEKGFPEYWKDIQSIHDLDTDRAARILSIVNKSGSNSFVLNGKKTFSKQPILTGDPHLDISLPSFWIICGIKSPSYHVVGLTIPSMPFITIGRNADIAWGGTNMAAWSTDLVDVSKEDAKAWATRSEKIKVRFWKDREVQIHDSTWGPVMSELSLFRKGERDIKIALKWVGDELSDEITAFLTVNKSKNWNEFQAAFDTYAVVGIYYTYADRRGNIALLPAAKLPSRTVKDKIVYHPELEPSRWRSQSRLNRRLSILNPSSNFIASANNIPSKDPMYISPFNLYSQRFDRITELLSRKAKWKKEDLLEVQKDFFSKNALQFSRLAVQRIEFAHFSAPWLNVLKEWNGRFTTESKGPVLFDLLVYHATLEVFKSRLSPDVIDHALSSPIDLVLALIKKIESDGISRFQWEKIVQKVDRDERKYKTWGDIHRLALTYPLDRIPIIGGKFVFREIPWPGSYDTVMKAKYAFSNKISEVRFGAQSRYLFDLSGKNENYFMLLGGEDGWLGSENFDDMVDLWQRDRWVQFPLEVKEVEKQFKFQTQIVPLIVGPKQK